jgi:hypothetical protein
MTSRYKIQVKNIHFKLIEKSKERLSTTSLTISEIAYELERSILYQRLDLVLLS